MNWSHSEAQVGAILGCRRGAIYEFSRDYVEPVKDTGEPLCRECFALPIEWALLVSVGCHPRLLRDIQSVLRFQWCSAFHVFVILTAR